MAMKRHLLPTVPLRSVAQILALRALGSFQRKDIKHLGLRSEQPIHLIMYRWMDNAFHIDRPMMSPFTAKYILSAIFF